jgi:hypothetical protein
MKSLTAAKFHIGVGVSIVNNQEQGRAKFVNNQEQGSAKFNICWSLTVASRHLSQFRQACSGHSHSCTLASEML